MYTNGRLLCWLLLLSVLFFCLLGAGSVRSFVIVYSSLRCAVTMTLFKGNMSANASVYFDVKAKEVPFVKMVKLFSNDKKVVFVASVKSSLSSLEIDWSCEQKDEIGNQQAEYDN